MLENSCFYRSMIPVLWNSCYSNKWKYIFLIKCVCNFTFLCYMCYFVIAFASRILIGIRTFQLDVEKVRWLQRSTWKRCYSFVHKLPELKDVNCLSSHFTHPSLSLLLLCVFLITHLNYIIRVVGEKMVEKIFTWHHWTNRRVFTHTAIHYVSNIDVYCSWLHSHKTELVSTENSSLRNGYFQLLLCLVSKCFKFLKHHTKGGKNAPALHSSVVNKTSFVHKI